jgi:kinesin family protein 4/21/27
LAGSEKRNETGTTGVHAKEATDINKSLHVLRKVITALTEKEMKGGKSNDVIPYRESKLTSLLKQSLGGNSYTLMIACLSPADRFFEENLSTLQYAARASQISNLPTKNVDPKLLILNDQKKKITDLEKELRSATMHIQNLSQLQQEKDNEILKLNRTVTKLVHKNDVLAQTKAQWIS